MRDFDGRWIAVADLADWPEVGIGETAAEALDGAFAAFGLRVARDLREGAIRAMGVER